MLQLSRQLRDRRFRLCQDILGLEHVETGCGTPVEPVPRNSECPPLLDDILMRDNDLLLQRTNADIVRCDIAEQRHQHVVISRDRSQIGRIGRLHPAPELTPKIHLPRDLRAEGGAPKVPKIVERVRARIGPAGLVVAGIGSNLLRLRVEFADGDAKSRTGFKHAGAGSH